MKFLVIGLGSMGKRRVRNLTALGQKDIIGFDLRADRRSEAHDKYGLPVFDTIEAALAQKPDAAVISLPPDLHMPYASLAVDAGASVFTEASVTDDGAQEVMEKLRAKGLIGFPSCTMRYYPGPRKVKELVQGGAIGKPLVWTYHSGQYLPDWHPWERIQDFYVSRRSTGGCREIVPFELSWLLDVFGMPVSVTADVSKVSDLPIDIDDVYMIHLVQPNGVRGELVVDVIARAAVRSLRVLGSEGTLEWDSTAKLVRVYDSLKKEWATHSLETGTVESGYINPEEPYVREMADFVECIRNKKDPDYDYREDLRILNVLYACEESSKRGTRREF